VTYQSNPSSPGKVQDKLFYRTTKNFLQWSKAQPLAQDLAPNSTQRQIDAALVYTGHGLLLGYKASRSPHSTTRQHFTIASSESGSLNGPWRIIGEPSISVYTTTIENYEFVFQNGSWDLIATSNIADQPWLFRLVGTPATPRGWLSWTKGQELNVPYGTWDHNAGISSISFEQDNSAFLCNITTPMGYSYLVYSGSTTLSAFGGWGHPAIGIARSHNLTRWVLPPH
jgi:hypothetical protein